MGLFHTQLPSLSTHFGGIQLTSKSIGFTEQGQCYNRPGDEHKIVNDPGFRAVTFDELRIAYKQQAEALLDGGADILMVETVFDTLNAKAGLFAIEEVKEERGIDIPIMLSGTITAPSRARA